MVVQIVVDSTICLIVSGYRGLITPIPCFYLPGRWCPRRVFDLSPPGDFDVVSLNA